MSKQSSFILTPESEQILKAYEQYCEEVNKKVGLPVNQNLSKNQLLNGALSLLGVCNDRYNVFNVKSGIELFT